MAQIDHRSGQKRLRQVGGALRGGITWEPSEMTLAAGGRAIPED